MSAKAIRKELAILREKLISEGMNANLALNTARQAMNAKYGHTWRNEPYLSKQNCRSKY